MLTWDFIFDSRNISCQIPSNAGQVEAFEVTGGRLPWGRYRPFCSIDDVDYKRNIQFWKTTHQRWSLWHLVSTVKWIRKHCPSEESAYPQWLLNTKFINSWALAYSRALCRVQRCRVQIESCYQSVRLDGMKEECLVGLGFFVIVVVRGCSTYHKLLGRVIHAFIFFT